MRRSEMPQIRPEGVQRVPEPRLPLPRLRLQAVLQVRFKGRPLRSPTSRVPLLGADGTVGSADDGGTLGRSHREGTVFFGVDPAAREGLGSAD